MYLLKSGTFTFDKILESGYSINEQPNLISKVQFVNGKRKKIVTAYTDCVIAINLGGLEASDINAYLDALVDGTYEYRSVDGASYKTANFIVTKPVLTINKAYSTSEQYFDDFTVTLEKSSDVEGVSL